MFTTNILRWILFPVFLSILIAQYLPSTELPAALTHISVALVIAHPDDEAMFFGPTLAQLAAPASGNNVSIVCFSAGDFEGLGATRTRELVASARGFGVPPARVMLLDEPDQFPDSQAAEWDKATIAARIDQLLDADTKLLTFDADGISGHANHRALYHAAVLTKQRSARDVYVLQSLPVWRKYAGYIDALVTYLGARFTSEENKSRLVKIVSSKQEIATTRAAMTDAHVSQMKWFRYGWIYLSRYMIANDLVHL
jgi:N-acetylglucosaminylphosphatidylinositol deacetylase